MMNTQKAKTIAKLNLCKVMQRDAKGKIKHVLVPGTEGKQYNVYLTRVGGTVNTECKKITGIGEVDCLGNHKTLCTHSLTALFVAAGEKSAFCEREASAELLKNLHHGFVTPVRSKQADKTFYLVTWK